MKWKREAEIIVVVLMVFIVIILTTTLASASVVLHNESIVRTVTGGSLITGAINVSIENEEAESMVTSNFGGNVTLLEMLSRQGTAQGKEYACVPATCRSAYRKANDNVLTKLLLSEEGEKSFGWWLEGSGISIVGIELAVSSSGESSCMPQLEIAAFSDNRSLIRPELALADPSRCGPAVMGCFDSSLEESAYKSVTLGTTPYCMLMELGPAPAFHVAGVIKANGNRSALNFRLHNRAGELLGSCTAAVGGVGTQIPACQVNVSVAQRDKYFVCVAAKDTTEKYEMRFESKGEVCGGAGVGKSSTGDYELLVTPLAYARVVNMSVAQAYKKSVGKVLADEADKYLEQVYGRNCTAGCTIPFTFHGSGQEIVLENSTISYVFEENRIVEKRMFELERMPALLSSLQPLVLELKHAELRVPLASEERTLRLRIGAREVLGARGIALNILQGFSFDVVPTVVLVGVPTTFTLVSSENISSSRWNFGDGSIVEVNGSSTVHVYRNGTSMSLEVSAKNSKGVTMTRQFQLLVGQPRESLGILVNSSREAVEKLKREMNILPREVQAAVEQRVNVSGLSASVEAAERVLSTGAADDSKAAAAVGELLNLKIPKAVGISAQGVLPLSFGLRGVDTSYALALVNASIPAGQEEKLLNALLDWNQRRVSGQVNFTKVVVRDAAGKDSVLLSYYAVSVEAKEALPEGTMLVIDYPRDELKMIQPLDVRKVQTGSVAGVAIPVQGGEHIAWSVDKDVDVSELHLHVVPPLNVLGKFEESKEIPPPLFPTGLLIFWIVLLVVGTLVVYVALQEWYKKRYERYLFPNPDDLYNVITFIANSRDAGMSDDAVRRQLRGSGWSGEQLSYAFRRLDGKRTGMWEIPVFSWFEHRHMRAELAKRRQSGKLLFGGRRQF